MPRRHSPFTLIRGDTWEIEGRLSATDGTPLDLSAAEIEWALFTQAGRRLVSLTRDDGIVVTDASAGAILITVSADKSKDIDPGPYPDQLRVTVGGAVSTMWTGGVTVEFSAFT